MKLDEQLYINLPVDRADGTVVWIHAAAVSREVFERYWLVMAKAFAMIYGQGLSIIAGPRIAALALRRAAEDAGEWEGPTGVQNGLMAEIRRLANAVGPNGQIMPLDVAKATGLIDDDDMAEVEGVLVFFTLAWRLNRQAERISILDGAAKLWGASMSSANLQAFAGSLRTSNGTASTGATPATPSSPPSSIGQPAPALRNALPIAPTTSPGGPPMSFAKGT